MKEENTMSEMARQDDGKTTFGGTGQPVNLYDLALRMCQRQVQLAARGDGGLDGHIDAELKELLLQACRTAQQSGLHAEQLVILLKDAWTRTPAAPRRHGRDAEEAFARLVTLSIDEFYRMELGG